MQIREDVDLEELSATVDNEGFWYSVSDGGWIKPEDVLDNDVDIRRVQEAIATLQEFESLIPVL